MRMKSGDKEADDCLYSSILRKKGCLVAPIHGGSMLPLLRQDTDAVVLVPVRADELRPMDLVLFSSSEPGTGRRIYILHRLLEIGDETCVSLGDNNPYPETVETVSIIGRVTEIFRGEKKISLNSLRYRVYMTVWCRPWRARTWLLRGRSWIIQIGRRVWHRCRKILCMDCLRGQKDDRQQNIF